MTEYNGFGSGTPANLTWQNDSGAYTFGQRFRVDTSGLSATKIRFYIPSGSPNAPTSGYTVALYEVGNTTPLASVSGVTATIGAWNEVSIGPISLSTVSDYQAAVLFPGGYYGADTVTFASGSYDPAGPINFYTYGRFNSGGTLTYPNTTFGQPWYGVDVTVSDGTPSGQSGTGSSTGSGPTGSGSGSITYSGTGASTGSGPTGSGAGQITISGTGASTGEGPTGSGTGSTPLYGSGGSSGSGPTGSGTGTGPEAADTLQEILLALAEAAAGAVVTPTLKTYGWNPDDVVAPCVFVAEYEIDYDRAMAGGLTVYTVTLRVLTSRADERSGQGMLARLVHPTGAASVKAAVESSRSPSGALGGLVQDLHVERVQALRFYQHAEANYVGAEFTVKVLA